MNSSDINIWWESVPKTVSGYAHVLVKHHKHGKNDWQISFGILMPHDNYKKYRVLIYVPIMGGEWKEIRKRDVLSIGRFSQYGYVDENLSG